MIADFMGDIYIAAPGIHDSPMRWTSAMNLELEMGWQVDVEPAAIPGVGTWTSGE